MTHSREYVEALESQHWADLREVMWDENQGFCQRCDIEEATDLHHLHYDTLGRETPRDVQFLCRECHVIADRERVQIKANKQWYARLNGWATKVYGEMWYEDYDQEEVEEKFYDWLESRS